MAFQSGEMLLEGGEYVPGLGSPLVVLGLIDPADHAIGIGQDRRGDRQPGKTRRPGMDFLVSQPVAVCDFEFTIRKHDGLQLMLRMSYQDLRGTICADRDDLDRTRVELGPEFLPSPQLGDTIRSPVAPEEFHQDGLAREACAREFVTVFIERHKAAQALAHPNGIVTDGLRAHEDENTEKRATKGRDDCRDGAHPAPAQGQGDNSEHRPARPARHEAATIGRDLDMLDSLGPEAKGSGDQQEGAYTEYGSRHGPEPRSPRLAFQSPVIPNAWVWKP